VEDWEPLRKPSQVNKGRIRLLGVQKAYRARWSGKAVDADFRGRVLLPDNGEIKKFEAFRRHRIRYTP